MGRLINKDNLLNIISLWGFDENVEIIEEDISYETNRETHIWTVNEDYILKMTTKENQTVNNIFISELLSKAGIPAQKVVTRLSGESYYNMNDRYYTLFTKLKGSVLKDYYDGDYIERGFYLGQCLAELHEGLKSITDELIIHKKIWDNNMINELEGWVNDEILKYIPKCGLSKDKIDKFNNIRKDINENFKNVYYKLPRQIIHRDFHRENMIFQNEKLVGYIDFDLCQINARIFDLCYLCTGSLASIFDKNEMREKWISFAKSAINGYESKSDITTDEKNSIKYMMFSIELIMVGYFAKDGYTEIANSNIEMVDWINDIW